MEAEILIYDGVEELDALGPLDVLGGAGFDVKLVTDVEARTVTSANGVGLVAAAALSEAPTLLLVPGGGYASRRPQGAWAEMARGTLPAAIAERFAAGSTIAGVCTGVMLLAAGGLLRGRPAVTHHAALEDLAAAGADVIADARVVDDGRLATCGGVWLVERYRGPEAAAARAAALEHQRVGRVHRSPSPLR